jgi:short-subunit dehydrogenase
MKIQLKKLSEQVIVITGASSGIGLTTARQAAKQGAKLVLAARNEDALKQISDELNSQGAQTIYVAADVAKKEDVQRIAEAAIERFGGFDTWMNIAGVGIFGKNEEISDEDMRRLFDVNFWGIVYGSLVAAQHLKLRGGALINMGSAATDRGVPLQGIYSASKHAIKGFTESLRVELEEEGAPISVTLVKPSCIDTMFVKHAKNYMEVEPRLPPPVYAPEIAAQAFLYAADHPVRDLYAGSQAKMMGACDYYMPRVFDQMMKRFMFKLQRSNAPARNKEDNSLHTYKADLLERGGVGWRARETSVYTNAVTHPAATKALMLGTGLALAAFLQARRRHQPTYR